MPQEINKGVCVCCLPQDDDEANRLGDVEPEPDSIVNCLTFTAGRPVWFVEDCATE